MTWLADISKYKSNQDWLSIVAAVVFAEVFFILLYTRSSPILATWYRKFGLTAVLADCLVILLGFAVTRYLYRGTFIPWKFVLTFLAVQIIHDLLYYFVVVVPYPRGQNDIIDFMKTYGKTTGIWSVLGDSSMVIVMSILAMIFAAQSPHISISALLFGLYMMPYMIYRN